MDFRRLCARILVVAAAAQLPGCACPAANRARACNEPGGAECEAGWACEQGHCVLADAGVECPEPCPEGSLCEGGSCLPIEPGLDAGSGPAGDGGSDAGQCPPGTLSCPGGCQDPKTSAFYCGASGDCLGANAGVACGPDEACVSRVCLNQDASLASLGLSEGLLEPAFSPDQTLYDSFVSVVVDTVTVVAQARGVGATVRVNGAVLPPGGTSEAVVLGQGAVTQVTVEVTAKAGNVRAYVIRVTRGAVGYLKASTPQANDFFGYRVAVSGNTLAVGAYGEDSAATGINGNELDGGALNSGAVYVFVRSQGVWVQQAYLKATNSEAGDLFGHSLSLAGDTLAVGAYGEDSSATGVQGDQSDNNAASSGAVYVFQRTGATWVQEAYLKASNTEAADYFGYGVSLSGDTLAVGAYGEDSNASGVNGNQHGSGAVSSGAVYVFRRSGGSWGQEAYLKASNSEAGDLFGQSVSVSGETLAVGAWGERSSSLGVNGDESDNTAVNSGAAYVFVRTGSAWVQQAYVKPSNTQANDYFGFRVSLSGSTLAVGAWGEDSAATGVGGDQADGGASASGAVYVFVRSGADWSQQAYLKASNTEASDFFGRGLAVSGDFIAVGAYGEDSSAVGVGGAQGDNGASTSGAVYVFERIGGQWAQRAYLKATNTEAGDYFGYDVALSRETIAVGAYGEDGSSRGWGGNLLDNGALSSGAVYLY